MCEDSWLPELVCFEGYKGQWDVYLEEIHCIFSKDFIQSKPAFPNKSVRLKRHPEYDGKSATFWHFITEGSREGSREADRTPDLRRCERIGWPRAIIDAFPSDMGKSDKIVWWKEDRHTSKGRSVRILLALPDFSYVFILDERDTYVLPWTAYRVEWETGRRKMKSRYQAYWR
ncbi:MAG: hypothetical protein RR889_07190 [Akkermansia sp.]